MNWGKVAAFIIDKIPFERVFAQEQDHTQERAELKEILHEIEDKRKPPEVKVERREIHLIQPDIQREFHIKKRAATKSDVTTEETIMYQNREISKILLQMERHAAQGFRINGKSCDCGSKHLPDLEALCEETIPMVNNPELYYDIINWVRIISDKITPEANDQALYRSEYPGYSAEARDYRKSLMGTLDFKVLASTGSSPDTNVKQNEVEEISAPEAETPRQIPETTSQESDTNVEESENEVEDIPVKQNEKSPETIPAAEATEEEIIDDRPITANGTVCADLQPMKEWVAIQDPEKCHSCLLQITIPWYYDELRENGRDDLIKELEPIQLKGDPEAIGAELDLIKEKVEPGLKQRLLEFDCATQSF